VSSEKLKAGKAQSQQRSEAAVFVEDQRAPMVAHFHMLSRAFQIENQDMLPDGHGVVAQFADSNSSTTTTLLFDARGTKAGHYIWELTSGNKGAREIWQIESFEDEVHAKHFKTSVQGQFMHQSVLDPEGIQKLYVVIDHMLDSSEVKEQIYEKRARKQRIEDSLAVVSFDRFKPENKRAGIYANQYEQLKRLYQHQGFTALAPYSPRKTTEL